MPDSRHHPRKDLHLPVAFQSGDGPRIDAACDNISLGGMFIETKEPGSYGMTLRITIQLPGLKQETRIDAVVRWHKGTGMGVQFGPMGARETHALTVLISGQK